jgi:hypothetical protein
MSAVSVSSSGKLRSGRNTRHSEIDVPGRLDEKRPLLTRASESKPRRLRITSARTANRWFHFLHFRPDDVSSHPMEPFRHLGSKGFVTHLRPNDASKRGQTMLQVTRGGSQNRNGAEGEAEASQAPGTARAPKQCRDRRAEQEKSRKQARHSWSAAARADGKLGNARQRAIASTLREAGPHRFRRQRFQRCCDTSEPRHLHAAERTPGNRPLRRKLAARTSAKWLLGQLPVSRDLQDWVHSN